MNYYNYNKNKNSRYKGAKKRITLNILIIIALILAVVAFSLVLGNHLKHKLETTEINRDPIETLPEDPGKDNTEDETLMKFKNDRTAQELEALEGYLDLDRCPDEQTAAKYVDYLKKVGYSGIVFSVSDERGMLSYDSRAVADVIGSNTSGSVTSYEKLKVAAERANILGMKTTAVATLPDLDSKDEEDVVKRTVFKSAVTELGELGFDEFIFKNATDAENFTSQRADVLYSFVSKIREALPETDIGLVLDRDILDNPEQTPVLELVFRFCDFLVMDFSTGSETFDDINVFLTSHSGSMNAYNLRFLSGESTPDSISACYAVYLSGATKNISFVVPLKYTDLTDKDGNFLFESKMPEYTVENGTVKTDSSEKNADN